MDTKTLIESMISGLESDDPDERAEIASLAKMIVKGVGATPPPTADVWFFWETDYEDVQVGPFYTEAEALAAMKHFQGMGADGAVHKLLSVANLQTALVTNQGLTAPGGTPAPPTPGAGVAAIAPSPAAIVTPPAATTCSHCNAYLNGNGDCPDMNCPGRYTKSTGGIPFSNVPPGKLYS